MAIKNPLDDRIKEIEKSVPYRQNNILRLNNVDVNNLTEFQIRELNSDALALQRKYGGSAPMGVSATAGIKDVPTNVIFVHQKDAAGNFTGKMESISVTPTKGSPTLSQIAQSAADRGDPTLKRYVGQDKTGADITSPASYERPYYEKGILRLGGTNVEDPTSIKFANTVTVNEVKQAFAKDFPNRYAAQPSGQLFAREIDPKTGMPTGKVNTIDLNAPDSRATYKPKETPLTPQEEFNKLSGTLDRMTPEAAKKAEERMRVLADQISQRDKEVNNTAMALNEMRRAAVQASINSKAYNRMYTAPGQQPYTMAAQSARGVFPEKQFQGDSSTPTPIIDRVKNNKSYSPGNVYSAGSGNITRMTDDANAAIEDLKAWAQWTSTMSPSKSKMRSYGAPAPDVGFGARQIRLRQALIEGRKPAKNNS